MYRSQIAPAPRKGIILLVVLALLTLFTIVGISFVLYADSQAVQSRNEKDRNADNWPNVSPEECLSVFLDQFIYDVCDDSSGVYSSLRGHSLSRNMYGFNYTLGTTPGQPSQYIGNMTPFIGIGRLHYPSPTGLMDSTTGVVVDDWKLINYMYFAGDNFLRDPECYGSRSGLSAARGPYAASANVPYTYPDLNNFYLGAIDGSGNLITPSFHREWLFGRLDDPNNPNWTNAVGKYLTLRPRPNEHPNFPFPVDRGGDVKNLMGYPIGNPGGCDSIWMDIGAPVLTTPDGTKYKMLVAPLILELDGRVNLHAHGNIMNGGTAHRSLMGLGPWEVNLGTVLTPAATAAASEWTNLFVGTQPPTPGTQPTISGKYGLNNGTNPFNGASAPQILTPHSYAQLSYRGAVSTPLPLPTANPNSFNAQGNYPAFPTYPVGYDNAVPGAAGLVNHPLLYNYYAPTAPNRRFRLSNLERLFRTNDTGYEELTSTLERLLPNNFSNLTSTDSSWFNRRNLVTPISGDLNQPGISPYNFWPPTASSGTYVASNGVLTPQGFIAPDGPPYWRLSTETPSGQTYLPLPTGSSPYTSVAVPIGSDFTTDWRSAIFATNGGNPWNLNNNANVTAAPLPRLDLNSPFTGRTLATLQTQAGGSISTPNPSGLTPYPSSISALDPPAANMRFDSTAYATQFVQAQKDRQYLARQIYLRLLAAVGLSPSAPTSTAAPGSADLRPRRWLAQLAVNMVDFMDNDDISTPFNFYTLHDANPGVANPTPTQGGYNIGLPVPYMPGPNYPVTLASGASPAALTPQTPAYWVFGTELPRVVINEVMMQYTPPTQQQFTAGTNTTMTTQTWVELYNPMELTPSQNPNVTVVDRQPVLLGMPAAANQASTVDPRSLPAAYAAYQLLVADQNMLPVSPTTTTPPAGFTILKDPNGVPDNSNVLGLPLNTFAMTTNTEFGVNTCIAVQNFNNPNSPNNNQFSNTDATNPLPLLPQQFLLVTPQGMVETQNMTNAGKSAATVAPMPTANPISTTASLANPTYPNGLVPNLGNANANSPPNLVYQTSNLQFTSTITAYTNPLTVGSIPINNILQGNGATVMLQRLANPHLPPNSNPILPSGALNPWYNPYVTIDYISNIPVYNTTNPSNAATPPAKQAYYASVGKEQPYTGFMNPTFVPAKGATPLQQPNTTNTTSLVYQQFAGSNYPEHTFGMQNAVLPSSNAFDWLTHLDRMLVSPLELMFVSQYPPHQLTQKFMLSDPNQTPPAYPLESNTNRFQHAPQSTWYDERTRLYRVFEFLETRDRLANLSNGNRTTGKININAIWDFATFQALCDAQPGNDFSPQIVPPLWSSLLALRSPNNYETQMLTNQGGKVWNYYVNGSQVGPTNMLASQVAQVGKKSTLPYVSYQVDRPFLSLAQGSVSAASYPKEQTQYPNGQGINDTILRSTTNGFPDTSTSGFPQRLFALSSNVTNTDNPYMNMQLLTKIFNNVTTRSNTFVVLLTVGFFQVTNPNTQPVTLGAEMNWSEGRAIRHRMFAIIDRTALPPQPFSTKPALYRPGADTTGLVPYWSIIN